MEHVMTRTAEVAVKSIGKWKPGQYKPYTKVKVVICKDLKTDKELNLSLNAKDMKRVELWERAIAPGNVLKVVVSKSDKSSKEYIDFKGAFEIIDIKPMNKKESNVYTNVSESSSLIIETTLKKLEKIEEKERVLSIERGKCYAAIAEASSF